MTAATVMEPGRLSLAEEGFEYARARIGARLAWRPTAAAWQRLQAARGLGAWIAVARAAAFAPYVSGVAATDALDAIEAGSFTADNYGVYSYMTAGGCSLAPLGTFDGKVPADVMALVAAKEAAIRDGSFTVEINDNEPKSS